MKSEHLPKVTDYLRADSYADFIMAHDLYTVDDVLSIAFVRHNVRLALPTQSGKIPQRISMRTTGGSFCRLFAIACCANMP